MYLNKVDWKLVWAAHNKRYEKYFELHFHFWDLCAFYGYLDLIKWGVQTGKAKISAAFFDYAARGGHLTILKWGLRQNLTYKPDHRTILVAIEHGHHELVIWYLKLKGEYVDNYHDLYSEARTYLYFKAAKWLEVNYKRLIKE